ncbi:hypothetical protein BP6252_12989 [Coleophoma cylindrospora]|uniref:Uncharacterized protein n=1 Tax=Coleophoma cylindrospora TaxID=1849047 RepID=A0A3D8QDH1_9HELO|nr:hypothetical protein BP6252_12989 [Coleophoma cylindrospora]
MGAAPFGRSVGALGACLSLSLRLLFARLSTPNRAPTENAPNARFAFPMRQGGTQVKCARMKIASTKLANRDGGLSGIGIEGVREREAEGVRTQQMHTDKRAPSARPSARQRSESVQCVVWSDQALRPAEPIPPAPPSLYPSIHPTFHSDPHISRLPIPLTVLSLPSTRRRRSTATLGQRSAQHVEGLARPQDPSNPDPGRLSAGVGLAQASPEGPPDKTRPTPKRPIPNIQMHDPPTGAGSPDRHQHTPSAVPEFSQQSTKPPRRALQIPKASPFTFLPDLPGGPCQRPEFRGFSIRWAG